MSFPSLGLFGVDAMMCGIATAAAFPVIATTATSLQSVGTTSHVVTMPASVASGDLLIIGFMHTTGTLTTPTGWTLTASLTSASAHQLTIFHRVSDGTEGASVTITSGSSVRTTHQAYRITTYQSVPEGAVSADNTNNQPSLSPTWGEDKTLWIAFLSGRRSDWSASAAPTNYATIVSSLHASNVNTDRNGIVSANRSFESANDDPDGFTITGTIDTPLSILIAVRPA